MTPETARSWLPPVDRLQECVAMLPDGVRAHIIGRHAALAGADLSNAVVAEQLHTEAAHAFRAALADPQLDQETVEVLRQAFTWHIGAAVAADRRAAPSYLPERSARPRSSWEMAVRLAVIAVMAVVIVAVVGWLIYRGQWGLVGVIAAAAIAVMLVVGIARRVWPEPGPEQVRL